MIFYISVHFVTAILFILTLASDRAVLNGNNVFSILVVSAKKRYFRSGKMSSFSRKIFVFVFVCFKVKILKTSDLSDGGLF